MTSSDDRGRLDLPENIRSDPSASEIVSIWYNNDKVKIITRSGTGLDVNPQIWGNILAGLAKNIALSIHEQLGVDDNLTLERIRDSMERNWSQ